MKPVIMWAVLDRNKGVIRFASRHKGHAEMMAENGLVMPYEDWRAISNHGYRVVKVEVREVEQ